MEGFLYQQRINAYNQITMHNWVYPYIKPQVRSAIEVSVKLLT